MWKDQDLHKLFRSRLPIADLPPAFADRLTNTILAEVAALRQADPVPNDSLPEKHNESTSFQPAQPPTRLAVKCNFLLLL